MEIGIDAAYIPVKIKLMSSTELELLIKMSDYVLMNNKRTFTREECQMMDMMRVELRNRRSS